MFTGMSHHICQQAWEMIIPSIIHAWEERFTNRFAGTIVVLDPLASTPDRKIVKFTQDLTTEQDPKYMQIAMAKAELTNRWRLPSSVIQHEYPHLYQAGNTKHGGSTIDGGGLIVAFSSGVQAVFDEMISEWMASAIRALCRHEMTRSDGGVMVSDYSYIGGDV